MTETHQSDTKGIYKKTEIQSVILSCSSKGRFTSLGTATAAVLSGLDYISLLKEEQRTTVEDYLGGTDVSALLLTGSSQSLIY